MKRSNWIMRHLQMTRMHSSEWENRENRQRNTVRNILIMTKNWMEKLRPLVQNWRTCINMVFILSEKFWAAEGQESTLVGHVFSHESFECRLVEAEETLEQQAGNPRTEGTANKLTANQLCFSKPTKEMANHLKPLFITANFGGVPILKIMLALWNEEGYMEIVEADPRPFLPSAMCFKARYYHDDLGPFTFLGVNQNGRLHGVTAQRLIEDGLNSSLEDWDRPFVLNFQNSDV
ncbi:unnamed protein product [Prunus brigantina]